VTYSNAEILSKRLIIEGIMAIQTGDNPRIVEQKLAVFLPPGLRPVPAAKPER
jgi:chemotaxis protein MotA